MMMFIQRWWNPPPEEVSVPTPTKEPEIDKPLLTPEEPLPPVKHHRYPATTRCPRNASTEEALFYYQESKVRAQKQESRANIRIKELKEKQRQEEAATTGSKPEEPSEP